MKKTQLSILIATVLTVLPTGLQAATSTASVSTQINAQLTMEAVAQRTFERIEHLKNLAERNEGTFERDGYTYLNFNGFEYRVNFDGYPLFPLGNDAAFRAVVDIVDENWEFLWSDGGFYLLERDFGVLNDDDTGCYVGYSLASRGSQNNDGSYMWEHDMVQRIVTSDCGGLTQPVLGALSLASLSDEGMSLSWDVGSENDVATLTLKNMANPLDLQTFENVKSGFFVGSLTPQTRYEARVQVCNDLACAAPKTLSFSTRSARLGFSDLLPVNQNVTGDLAGGLAFAQTHTNTAPFGNDVLGDPDLVMKRQAKLLFTPLDENSHQMWLEVFHNGQLLERMAMLPPSALSETDQPDNGRPKVVFSHKVWTAKLQWDWMIPGLSLKLTDDLGRESTLDADSIEFGGAPELVIQNIDMGMLMKPRGYNTMIHEMETLSADYFQKIPASKLVMVDYTPAYYPKVTMPNGNVYTTVSETDGSWHSGDMRGSIGKAMVSIGINNANVGILDTAGESQTYNRRYNHITAHTNVGMYTHSETKEPTARVHGGSGGGGIVTLEATAGNEWSHELGHNYGLGHFPYMASSHDMESGWGWDEFHQRFVGSLHWSDLPSTNDVAGEIIPPFMDEFRFRRDAQNGGESESVGTTSRYTYEHPKQSRRTQAWLNNGFNLDASSPTGYVKWDQESQDYQIAQTDTPVPLKTGVPVMTLLGIYDPLNELASQIYPPIYSNYGNVFEIEPIVMPEYKPEGWQVLSELTADEINSTAWKTMKIDNVQKTICQFTYLSKGGVQSNFIGTVNAQEQRCETSTSMYWAADGGRDPIISQTNDYALLSEFGEGDVMYTPNAAMGEVRACFLDKAGTAHEGAGFFQANYCQQLDTVKHRNGNAWRYVGHQGGMYGERMTSQRQCELKVQRTDGTQERIQIEGGRHAQSQSNKFHVNLPQGALPSEISISCRGIDSEYELDRFFPDQNPPIDKLKGPIFIGQEHGYRQVIDLINTFDEHFSSNQIDFKSIYEFDAYVARTWGASVLNNGVTFDSRLVGALYVNLNAVTGTRDYFLARTDNPADIPLDQQSNDDWRYLGSADQYINFALNPFRLDRSANIDASARVKAYFGEDTLLSWDARTSTKWGESENAVFVSDVDEDGQKSYFIQKRPGEGSEFPTNGQSNEDWYFVDTDLNIQAYVEALTSNISEFETQILDWYRQDSIKTWDGSTKRGVPQDVYVYLIGSETHYYRLKRDHYGYFPSPSTEDTNNPSWEYLGQFTQ